jgi:hypothetical protein
MQPASNDENDGERDAGNRRQHQAPISRCDHPMFTA